MKQELSSFYSFYEEVKKVGKVPSSRVISSNIIPLNKELSEIFKIPPTTEILYIKRLRLVDNKPLIFEHTYLPISRFKDFDVNLLNSTPMYSIFKEKYDVFHRKQESEQKDNLEKRISIIEKLKNLYTHSEPNTNLFRAIREIKEEWSNAGQVAKSELLPQLQFPLDEPLQIQPMHLSNHLFFRLTSD